jgi:hypothetical protein
MPRAGRTDALSFFCLDFLAMTISAIIGQGDEI